jgi:hypothetical protein
MSFLNVTRFLLSLAIRLGAAKLDYTSLDSARLGCIRSGQPTNRIRPDYVFHLHL